MGINLATNQAMIEYDETKTHFNEIKKEIESNGFTVNENTEIQVEDKKGALILRRCMLSFLFSLPVFSMMFGEFMM
ncbi:MAG: hypothetical protein H6767_07610 [Candidatus Peribacteria bacterium]|nr:MAG: hypothetical protein H6767_07610 [Candidatus Peribacteria bacterium]